MAKKDFTISQSALRIFYYEYKMYFFPFGILVLSFLLLLLVVLPQYREYFTLRAQTKETQTRIEGLKKNITTLSNLQTSEVSRNYGVVAKILPSDKDFIGVLEAIAKASANAGVAVGDFSFVVGDLATPSAQLGQRPAFDLHIVITGDRSRLNQFISELKVASPLAEARSFDINGDSAAVSISFYYTALPKTVDIQFDAPPPLLTDKEKKIIGNFESWQNSESSNSSSFITF